MSMQNMHMYITAFELAMLAHYYGTSRDFNNGDLSTSAMRSAVHHLSDEGLLQTVIHQRVKTADVFDVPAKYELTEKGRTYVNHLLCQPFPVSAWVMPSPVEPQPASQETTKVSS